MRYSSQRELVYNIVKESCDHPTADMVYAKARELDPTISLGTVYRNLNVLTENGDIASLESTDVKLHYDGKTEKHSHYICEKCNSIFDIMVMPRVSRFARMIGSVSSTKCVYYGICKNCQNNK